MLAPAREYARLARLQPPGSAVRAASRPALTLLILGVASAAGSTGRVDAAGLLSGALCWSFAVVIQAAAALVLIRSARSPHLDLRASLELWFLAHGPWSLWTIGATAAAFAVPSIVSLDTFLVTALIPSAWTAALVFAFCRQVLGDDARRARYRTAAHQCVTWSLIVLYLALATQIWPRILGGIAP